MIPDDILANNPKVNFQIFYAGGNTTNRPKAWYKPIGKGMAYILCVGGGSSGSGAAPTSTQGAGGGGTGAISSLIIPTYLLPDRLFVFAGSGGAAVGPNTGGNAGMSSWVGVTNSNGSSFNLFLIAGGGLTSSITGAAGNGSTAATNSSMNLCGMGLFTSLSGANGAFGGANAAGSNAQSNFARFLAGAGGGGGGSGNGGNCSAGGKLPIVNGGLGSTVTDGAPGENGITIFGITGFQASGGAGGGASTSGNGGNGGKGGLGCGGGGGGSSTTGTGGGGGAGGDGFVAIWCF